MKEELLTINMGIDNDGLLNTDMNFPKEDLSDVQKESLLNAMKDLDGMFKKYFAHMETI